MRTAIKTKKKRTVTAATKRTEHRPPETYPAVGKAAPAFVLESDSGKRIRLSDFRGKKVVVLFFYPRDLTSGCTKEACAFRDMVGSRRSKGVQILGVSADTIASHQKFRDKHDLSFPLLSDPDHSVAEKYGVWQDKSLYGRKYKGIARTTFVINRSGKIAHVFEKVKVSGHVDAVFEWIDASL